MPAKKTPKPDSVKREQQAKKWVRFIKVHRRTRGLGEVSVDLAGTIARECGISERTVWRDLQTLRMAYAAIGSNQFDGE